MNILLTGSSGFIGTYIRKNMDNKSNNILYGSISDIGKETIKFNKLYSDVGDILVDWKIDCIIHLASVIPDDFNNADYCLFLENTDMMRNLYDFSIKKGVKKFIYLSSFGSMRFPDILDIGDYYTMSKIVGEHFCAMMRRQNIQAISFRTSSPYGEYLRRNNVLKTFVGNAVKNQKIKIFGTGSREQNFTYVGDILKGIELVLNRNDIDGNYEIVGESSISMLHLAKMIIRLTNSKSKITFNGGTDIQEDYRPNYCYAKAFDDFSYAPISLEDGLKKYIAWYTSHENSHNF